MLALNQIVPDLTWLDAAGETQSLHGWRDRYRVVVLFARDRQTVATWQKATWERTGEFAERDMRSVIVGSFAPLASLRDEDGSMARSFEVESELTAFFLVGKDGTLKRIQNELPGVDELWRQIDSMPMRQQEMRQRG